ncbi:efflux RND transporter permease subunit [Priestia filamentosa]|uniref:efflux RND transporter permease subunit n=1 Tax=Priestia filamentosa TaxID=1402861 RepID=UPI001FB416EB|nr:efflux RND transporter permease subunit [Priestia filamentosa]UOE59951.1 efflux RND transporter permease subunit [Priestia filamentosa]
MKIVQFSVLRPIAMSMVIFFLIILGSVSVKNMSIDLFPELTFPTAVVTATYDGASPTEVENLLAQPIEGAMGTIPNIEKVSSVSQNGGALVLVQFNWGTDMDFATLKMREQIDAVRDVLPDGVQTPKVLRFNPSDLPIMQLAITDTKGNIENAKEVAEKEVKTAVDRLDGIASTSIEGGPEREVQLIANPQKLLSYGITLKNLQEIIGSENIDLPGGNVEDHQETLPIRITGKFDSLNDLEMLPIPTKKGTVLLNDLIEIEQKEQRENGLSYLNGKDAVGLSILKQSGTNTVQVAKNIHNEIEKLKEELPSNIKIQTIFDQSMFINQSISAVSSNMIVGSLLAAFVLFLFLRNFRSTMIISLAIPLSIMTTFIFMYFSNQTLNLLTLGGLALGVGMMVDNAIVILENIYRLRQEGEGKKDAAIKGTNQVGQAIIASTLTSVVVFLPIIFVDGLAAQLFKPLALVVSYSQFAALFTALIIVPLLSSLILKLKENEKKSVFDKFNNRYKALLSASLKHPKKTVGVVIVLFLLSFAGVPFIGTEFLPSQDQSYLSIEAELPPGSTVEKTYRKVKEINEKIRPVEEIANTYITIGGSSSFSMGGRNSNNEANYSVLLTDIGNRSRTDLEIAEDIRQKLKNTPNANITVSSGTSGFSANPISLKISGPNLETLRSLSDQTINLISKVDGVREPKANYEEGNPEVSISINRDKAAQYGIGSASVAQAVSDATKGLVATKLSGNAGEELNVRLLIDEKYISSTEELENLTIQTQGGTSIPLKAVSSISRDTGPSQITRSDRVREITVNADILNRDLGTITKDIEKTLKENLPLPNDQYKVTFGGQNEQMNDAFYKLSLSLALAVVLVYMVMAAQFESFFHPFLIMFSVPLTFIGIILGLLITNEPLGVGSLVGILILTGIVVNNAIVLIDYLKQLREEGYDAKSAILLAGPTRLRPIMMTALTSVLGLLPLMFGIGEGTEIQRPMAIVIIFGLTVSTFITLIFIPTVYYMFEQRRIKKKEKTG